MKLQTPLRQPLAQAALIPLLAGLALTLSACTTVGLGNGTVEPGNAPVAFSWTSTDAGQSGTMSVVIQNNNQTGAPGDAFSGPILQVSTSVRTDAIEPRWNGWRRGWSDWDYWGNYPVSVFTTHYSGKVIANLTGPNNQLLRCRFHLNTPAAGLRGGGQGECQFNGGRTVDAVFPPS